MKKLIALLAFICILQLSFSQDCETQKDKIQKDIESILSGNNLQDGQINVTYYSFSEIKNLSWLLTAYEQFLSVKNLQPFDICNKLKSLKIDKLKMLEKFFFFTLNHQANCKIPLDKETKEFAKNELNSNKLDDFYKAFILTSKYNLEQNLQIQCNSLPEFFDNTGSGLLAKNKLKEATQKKSPQIYEMAAICYQQTNFTASQAFTQAFDNAINGFVGNSAELSSKMIGYFESGASALHVTAANVLQIYKINQFIQNQQFNNKLNAYMNFISEGKVLHLTPQEKSVVFQLSKIMHSHPSIKLDSNSFELTDKKSIEIKGKILDYFGKELKILKEIKVNADLYYKDQLINKKLQVSMNEQNVKITVPVDDATQLGIYTLKFSISQNQNKFSEEVEIKFTTQLSIESMKIDIGDSNEKPSVLQHKVQFEKKFPTILEADQSKFIYLEFKLSQSFYSISPKQVAVRLINSQYSKATNQVIAQKQNSVYKAIIDLGDPDQILAYKGKYDLELIVADSLLSKNIQWIRIVATLNIDFKRELKTRPTENTDYVLKPDIQHYFAQPQPDPPKFITMGFIAFLAIALIIFLCGVFKLNLTSDKLFNGISVVLFILCVMAYIGVLVFFWVKINIFQTLFLFLILSIPTLITGNFALLALSPKEKEKTD